MFIHFHLNIYYMGEKKVVNTVYPFIQDYVILFLD
jgi:alpha-D-ribose 1-methylphosphonate 5-triphosphate synthase subunit PhnL